MSLARRSPNEEAAAMESLLKDARLRRLKAVRSASTQLQRKTKASFEMHAKQERAVLEQIAREDMTRETMRGISELEEQLREALASTGRAHIDAHTQQENLTAAMLHENVQFHAHVRMTNARFDDAAYNVNEMKMRKQALRDEPVEHRTISFKKEKELLVRITGINERAKARVANAPLAHPYDSLQPSREPSKPDYGVTRFHATPSAPSAIELARIESNVVAARKDHAQEVQEEQRRRTAVRGIAAQTQAQEQQISREFRTSLREATRIDQKQKLQLEARRVAKQEKTQQRSARIRSDFESEFPLLEAIEREAAARTAREKPPRVSLAPVRRRRRPPPANMARIDISPDDLGDRATASKQGPSILSADYYESVLSVLDEDVDSGDEVATEPIPAPQTHDVPQVLTEDGLAQALNLSSIPDASLPPAPVITPLSPCVAAQAAPSSSLSPSPTTPPPPPMSPPVIRPASPILEPDPTESLVVPRSPRVSFVEPATSPSSLEPPRADNTSIGTTPDLSIASELPSSSTATVPTRVSDSAEDHMSLDESLDAIRESLASPIDREAVLNSSKLTADDISDLDRRADELLRSHIPTTPQLMAMRSAPTSAPPDFALVPAAMDLSHLESSVTSFDLDTDDGPSSSFSQTLDETLAFLRNSQHQIQQMQAHTPLAPSSSLSSSGEQTLPTDGSSDDLSQGTPAAPRVLASNMSDALLLPRQQSLPETHIARTPVSDSSDEESKTSDQSDASLQARFLANKKLAKKIEERRASLKSKFPKSSKDS